MCVSIQNKVGNVSRVNIPADNEIHHGCFVFISAVGGDQKAWCTVYMPHIFVSIYTPHKEKFSGLSKAIIRAYSMQVFESEISYLFSYTS